MFLADLYGAREVVRGRGGAVRADLPQSLFPSRDDRHEGAARHLHPYRRHRHRPHRRGRLLRARGQCPHAVRRLLHAGEPGSHDAALPGAVRRASGGAGGELSGHAAGDVAVGDAAHRRCRRPGGGAADPRAVQFRLLRTFLSGRQARRRTRRGARPLRRERRRLHAHHRGAEARRRDLSTDRRRLPRPAGVPAGQRARAFPA